LGQDRIDLFFGQEFLHGRDDLAAEEFATVQEHRPESSVEELQIDDPCAFNSVGNDSDDGRVDVGSWPKNARGQNSQDFAIALRLHPDRKGAVVFAGRWSDDPFAEFLLDRHDHAFDEGSFVQQIADDRGRDVVGEVRDEFEFRSWDPRHRLADIVEQFGSQVVLIAQGIATQESHIGKGSQFAGRDRLEVPVDLDGQNRTGSSREGFGQRAHPGPDFQYDIARREFCAVDQQIEQIQIDQKILTVLGFRLKACALERPGKKAECLPIAHQGLFCKRLDLEYRFDLYRHAVGQRVGPKGASGSDSKVVAEQVDEDLAKAVDDQRTLSKVIGATDQS